MRFPPGALQNELDKRGMSQEEFAKIAGISADTVYRACKGTKIRKTSWGKILVGLTVVAIPEAPEGLRVAG